MTQPTSPDDVLTVNEAAVILGCTSDNVRALIRAGTLRSLTPGAQNYRLTRGDVEAHRDGRLDTRPDPMFVELGALEAERVALQRRIDALVEDRNRRIVAWRNQGASVTAIAQAAHLGRQHVTDVLRLTRAQIAAEK